MHSLSFRAGLSQINNLCNILSQSVDPNSLVVNWHLTHYCIKVIFCGNNFAFCVFLEVDTTILAIWVPVCTVRILFTRAECLAADIGGLVRDGSQ